MKKLFILFFLLLISFNVFATDAWYRDSQYGLTTLTTEVDTVQADVASVQSDVGRVSNCAITLSGTTFTITGISGNLSSTNVCAIGIKSNKVGYSYDATFTSNVSISFGGTSDFDGNTFGIQGSGTGNEDWSSETPMHLGVMADITAGGTNNYFTFSRIPLRSSGTTEATLCQIGDTTCDDEYDVFVLASGLTLENWVTQPITPIGWVTGTYDKDTGTGAFSLSLGTDTGFNDDWQAKYWVLPVGQRGAQTGHYTFGSGPTWATPSGYAYVWKMSKSCVVDVYFSTSQAGNCSNGSGTGAMTVPLPFDVARSSTSFSVRIPNRATINNVASAIYLVMQSGAGSLTQGTLTAATANNSMANAADDLLWAFSYMAECQ